jgi:HSP20 family molecular chaperone IbpA
VESLLEIALAGFGKEEVNVFTEYGKLFVEGQKSDTESDRTFVHKGLAQRSFKRVWTLSDDTEVREVIFEDGLLAIRLGKIVPEHHSTKRLTYKYLRLPQKYCCREEHLAKSRLTPPFFSAIILISMEVK